MVWEQRWHPLRQEWVMVAAHRQRRPWIGEHLPDPAPPAVAYDEACTFCPGNTRISGVVNPDYRGVFTFDNDMPCVSPDAPAVADDGDALYRRQRAAGLSRVVCYTPRHDLSLPEMPVAGIEELLTEWQDQYQELAARPEVDSVLVFENRGEVVGVSNPHPHCQIYAASFVFRNLQVEADACRRHLAEHGRPLFQDILAREQEDGRRLVVEQDSAVGFIPFFARYAFETYVAPRNTHASIAGLSAAERADLAGALRRVLRCLNRVWDMPMPYVMALHQAPADGGAHDGFHFHIEIHPPLRLPNVRKYLAGCEEGGGNFLSDTAPEEKAAELRALDEGPEA